MRGILLGLLVAAVGCGDFTLVEPDSVPGPTEPLMSVYVGVDRSDSSRYELTAFFYRGLASGGGPNEAADRAFYVEGTALQPTLVTTSGSEFWRYDWKEIRADSGAGADSLRIRPPVLAGSPLPGIDVTIPVPAREGPADVTWAEGQDLRLRVSSVVVAPTQLSVEHRDWTLELGDGCGGAGPSRPLLVAQGSGGAYPSEFRVPWEWLLSVTPAPTAACLRLVSGYHVSNAPYRMDVSVGVRLAWRIHVAGTS
jgi:hypothetical protein